jgi:small subunit ribosomal protein S4
MARHGPKARLCRREGVNLFGRPKYAKILEKRPGRPGVHSEAPRKSSGFALQLREKQKLRIMFGISESQCERYVTKAINKKGLTTDNLMKQLEMRLDNVLYRAGFALTRMQARQMATHGHFLVNARRVDIPSYTVRIGDKVEVRPKLKNSKLYPLIAEENKGYKPARWLQVNPKNLAVEITGEPAGDDFERIVDCPKIIEFYSR